jgi:hypothetical protein
VEVRARVTGFLEAMRFKEGDVVYQLAVVGALPGDALCA